MRRGEPRSGGAAFQQLLADSPCFPPLRYKQDLTPDQKTALIDLLRVQKHDGIGPEVRRELTTGAARGEMLEEPLGWGGDEIYSDDDAMSV